MHYGRIDPSTNSLKFPLSRTCRPGEQCFLSYGNFSSSHLLTFYGFLPQGDNPYDIIPLGTFPELSFFLSKNDKVGGICSLLYLIVLVDLLIVYISDIEDSDVRAPASEWSSHMVRGTWLSKNNKIFHYGLPTPLLDHLRKARNFSFHSNTPVNSLLNL